MRPTRVNGDLFYRVAGPPAWPSGPVRSSSSRFYLRPHLPGAPLLADVLTKIAANPYRFGGVLLLFGFVAVFVNQASFVYQVVLGAPIFEEAFKFGLALLIAWPMRFAPLQVLVAFAVGCGFGVLEHYVTYSFEDTASFIVRIAFHGGATLLSMVSFLALMRAAPRLRWGTTLLATFVHYVNNSLALITAPLILAGEEAQFWISATIALSLTASLYVLTVVVLVARGWFVRQIARLAAVGAPAESANRTPSTIR